MGDFVKVAQTNGTLRPRLYSEEDFRRTLDVDLLAPIYWAMRAIGSVAVDRARQGLRVLARGLRQCLVYRPGHGCLADKYGHLAGTRGNRPAGITFYIEGRGRQQGHQYCDQRERNLHAGPGPDS